MGEELFDVNPLVFEHHADDEAILVTADIENREVACHVRIPKRLADVLETSPFGLDRRIEPNLQCGFGIGDFCRSLEEAALADDVSDSLLAKC
jgi:hypothetical protein